MQATLPTPRPHARRPRTPRLLGAAALAAGAVQAIRTATRVRRELAASYRADDARLGTEWTAVRAVAGAGSLRVHARLHARLPERSGPDREQRDDPTRADVRRALPPVVLVHGWGMGSSYLVPLAARLVDHVPVYAPDLPGHGPSDHDARPLSIPELAEALARWMDAWGLRGALLVGHSLGCQVAAELAAHRPDLAAGLVLVAPTSDPAARTAAQQIARGLATGFFDRPTAKVWTALDYSRAGAGVLAAEMRELVSHGIEAVLPHVAAPVRVVRGARDYVVPQRWAETVAGVAGAPAPAVVPGWGHTVHYDAPEAVVPVVLELAGAVADAATARAAAPGAA